MESQKMEYSLCITPSSVTWAWQPGIVSAVAAPIQTWLRLFCFLEHVCARMATVYGGPCGDTRKGVPVPTAGLPTLHGPPPLLGS